MSTATTVWVPLVTAGVGLIAGIGAAMGTAILTQRRTDRREDVRWQREREDRQEQWRRERQDRQEQWQREDSLRWLQHRQAAYARLTTALFQWDAELRSVGERRQADAPVSEQTQVDWNEMDRREGHPRSVGFGAVSGPRRRWCASKNRHQKATDLQVVLPGITGGHPG